MESGLAAGGPSPHPPVENANRLDPQERTRRFVERQRGAVAAEGGGLRLFGPDGLSFGDLIDAVNPLQHIPIVSTIYRRLTGDEIAPGARIAGGALFGGPIGLAAAVVNLAVVQGSGEDIGTHALALLTGEQPDTPAAVNLAAAETMAGTTDNRYDVFAGSTQVATTGFAASVVGKLTAAADEPAGDIPAPVADRMMAALDRYQAMIRARRSEPDGTPGAAPAGSLLDGDA